MATNVEVTKNANENAVSLIRRFSRRVKGSGILPRMRSIITHERPVSKFRRKQRTLNGMIKKIEIMRLKKLGKITEKKGR